MKVKELLKNIKVLKYVNISKKELENFNIKYLIDNTKNENKLKNSCFVCINGFNFDSHILSNLLKEKGVKFLVCEKEVETLLPYIIVENTRKELGYLASNFYNNPSKKMKIIGVIGTIISVSITIITVSTIRIYPC